MPTLIVEDGTGLTTANAYAALAFVDQYHRDRGSVGWTGSQTVKQAAIILATEFIDLNFGAQFHGQRIKRDPDGVGVQALEWPREGVFDDEDDTPVPDDSVPGRIQSAMAELALVSLTTGLYPDPGDPAVSSKQVKVGRISKTTSFAGSGSNTDSPVITQAKLLLRRLLRSVGTKRLVRS